MLLTGRASGMRKPFCMLGASGKGSTLSSCYVLYATACNVGYLWQTFSHVVVLFVASDNKAKAVSARHLGRCCVSARLSCPSSPESSQLSGGVRCGCTPARTVSRCTALTFIPVTFIAFMMRVAFLKASRPFPLLRVSVSALL